MSSLEDLYTLKCGGCGKPFTINLADPTTPIPSQCDKCQAYLDHGCFTKSKELPTEFRSIHVTGLLPQERISLYLKSMKNATAAQLMELHYGYRVEFDTVMVSRRAVRASEEAKQNSVDVKIGGNQTGVIQVSGGDSYNIGNLNGVVGLAMGRGAQAYVSGQPQKAARQCFDATFRLVPGFTLEEFKASAYYGLIMVDPDITVNSAHITKLDGKEELHVSGGTYGDLTLVNYTEGDLFVEGTVTGRVTAVGNRDHIWVNGEQVKPK